VILVHAAVGQQEDFVTWRLRSLAANGYVAFAVDMFGTDHAVWEREEIGKMLSPMKEDRTRVLSRFKVKLNIHELSTTHFYS